MLGKVRPGVGDGRVEDDADRLFAVNLLGVIGVALERLLQIGRILAEVQEGLGCDLVDVLARRGLAAVFLGHTVEELVVLACDDADIAAAEGIGEVVVLIIVDRVVGDQQGSGDQAVIVLQHGLAARTVAFSPYEVQIMETVMEYEDGNKNMSWYAHKMGLSTSTYSKYVKKLVSKGLLEKYRTSDNRKNVILRVSPLGKKEYETYSAKAEKRWFKELFEKMDGMTPEELHDFQEIIDIWGSWHLSVLEQKDDEVRLLRIE